MGNPKCSARVYLMMPISWTNFLLQEVSRPGANWPKTRHMFGLKTYARIASKIYLNMDDCAGDWLASGAYTKELRNAFPRKVFPVDANGTLRLTYGKVEGSAPYDGMQYNPLSTARGILQKYVPGDPDFDMPERLVQLLQTREYGNYANEEGELVVCFETIHTAEETPDLLRWMPATLGGD